MTDKHKRVRERVSDRDDERLLSDAIDELQWCTKETRYVVGGSDHPQAEQRIGRVREALTEIDALLSVVEDRSVENKEQ